MIRKLNFQVALDYTINLNSNLIGATSGLKKASSSDNVSGTSSVTSLQQVGPSDVSAMQHQLIRQICYLSLHKWSVISTAVDKQCWFCIENPCAPR